MNYSDCGLTIGENIKFKVYSYDNNGQESYRDVKGKVIQITNSFITLDNGKYKESFKYSELCPCNTEAVEGEPYDLSLESYSTDIVSACINMLKKNKKGFVFDKEQVEKVKDILKSEETVVIKDNEIYYIEKI